MRIPIGEMFAAIVFLVIVCALFAMATCQEAERAQRLPIAACGECSDVRECGSLVCVPGKGWQESTK